MKKTACILFIVLFSLSMVFPAFAMGQADGVVEDTRYEAFLREAEKTDEPMVYLSTINANKDDLFTLSLYLHNAENLNSADLVLQYNPYMLEYHGNKPDEKLTNESGMLVYATEQVGPDILDIYGNIAHEVYVSMTTATKLEKSFSDCKVIDLYFLAIGGGTCPLELTAMSFMINGEEVKPKIVYGNAVVEGESASSWDYSAITSEALDVPDGNFTTLEDKGMTSFQKIALIAVALIFVIAIIILLVFGRGKITDHTEEEEEDEAEPQETKKTEPVKKEAKKKEPLRKANSNKPEKKD